MKNYGYGAYFSKLSEPKSNWVNLKDIVMMQKMYANFKFQIVIPENSFYLPF